MVDRLIRNQEDIDLSAKDIENICEGKVKIEVYHNLGEYNSIESLLQPFGAVALLYETKQNFGHWVALIEYEDHIEFFDPYGFSPDSELKYAKYDNTPYLTELIKNSSKPVRWSNAKLQTFAEDINTCGRWTSCRIRMKQLDNNSFAKMFKGHQHYTGDFWVSALTFLYTLDKTLNQ